MHNQTE